MRIVIIRSNPVSPDSRVEKETESLMQAGNKVTILCWDRDRNYREGKSTIRNSAGEADIFRLGIEAGFGAGKKNLLALIRFQSRSLRWLIRHRKEYDAIHACDLDMGYFPSKLARLLRKVFVYDVFDYYCACRPMPGRLKKIISGMENRVISRADAAIICSEKRKEQIRGSKPKRLVILHNAPHMQLIRPDGPDVKAKTGAHERVRIGYIGILGNTQRMLNEIADAISGRDDLEYHVGGFGQLEGFFEEMAEKHDNIFYYGKLPYASTLKLEEQMDILTAIYDPAMPNNRYAAPNKFYEALMLGKPLIMVHDTGMDDIVDRYRLGVTIDFNIQSFCDGVDRLIGMRDEWAEMGERGKALFREQYSWEIMGERLAALYRELEQETAGKD